MPVLMITCPKTAKPVSTDIELDHDTFKQLPAVRARLLCPACGEHHYWSKDDAWLAEMPAGKS